MTTSSTLYDTTCPETSPSSLQRGTGRRGLPGAPRLPPASVTPDKTVEEESWLWSQARACGSKPHLNCTVPSDRACHISVLDSSVLPPTDCDGSWCGLGLSRGTRLHEPV